MISVSLNQFEPRISITVFVLFTGEGTERVNLTRSNAFLSAVIGGIAGLILLVILIIIFWRRRRGKRQNGQTVSAKSHGNKPTTRQGSTEKQSL